MKIIEQNPKRIKFRHLPIDQWTYWLQLGLGGSLLFCLSIYILFFPTKSKLNCTRTQPKIGICQLEETGFGTTPKREIPLNTIQQAKSNYRVNTDSYSYEIVLVTSTDEIVLETSASREETAQNLANRINNFITNQEQKSLFIEIEDGFLDDFFLRVCVVLGSILFAFSPLIFLQSLTVPVEIWIFDKNSDKFTIIKQWLSGNQSNEYPLHQIADIQLTKNPWMIEIIFQSGEPITLEYNKLIWEKEINHEIKIAQIVEEMHQFLK